MGIAARTAHATEATISALVDAQDADAELTGIPANYFENRAAQLEQAVEDIAGEKADADEEFVKDKAALELEHELERIDLERQLEVERAEKLAQLEADQAAKVAELEEEHEAKVADLSEAQEQLEEQAEEFHHQAQRYSKNKLRCSYLDCLRGKASVPQERAGMLLFQSLMIAGMVLIMTSFNGYRHSGMDFFINYHWMYPLTFCMTFLIREWFMNDFTGALIAEFILPRFQGVSKATLITLTNIVCMVPLMSTIMTTMLYGFHDLGQTLLDNVPITIAVGACVNFFIVSPIVKMFYNNVIVANTKGETGTYNRLQEIVMPVLSMFNS